MSQTNPASEPSADQIKNGLVSSCPSSKNDVHSQNVILRYKNMNIELDSIPSNLTMLKEKFEQHFDELSCNVFFILFFHVASQFGDAHTHTFQSLFQHTHFNSSFNTHISTQFQHTFQLQFQHTYFKTSFNTHISNFNFANTILS